MSNSALQDATAHNQTVRVHSPHDQIDSNRVGDKPLVLYGLPTRE